MDDGIRPTQASRGESLRFSSMIAGLAGVVLLSVGTGAVAQTPSTVSTTLTASDPSWSNFIGTGSPCIIYLSGARKYKTLNINVATAGNYSITDAYAGIDGSLAIYSGSFNPLSPLDNCVTSVDDSSGATLSAGNYTLVLTSYHDGQLGNVSYIFNGPGSVSVVSATPVPTMSEWAMILFGTLLAGSTALYLQRRRLVA
jgi:hypothetical protein